MSKPLSAGIRSVSSTGEGKDGKDSNDSVWQRALSGSSVPANNSSRMV